MCLVHDVELRKNKYGDNLHAINSLKYAKTTIQVINSKISFINIVVVLLAINIVVEVAVTLANFPSSSISFRLIYIYIFFAFSIPSSIFLGKHYSTHRCIAARLEIDKQKDEKRFCLIIQTTCQSIHDLRCHGSSSVHLSKPHMTPAKCNLRLLSHYFHFYYIILIHTCFVIYVIYNWRHIFKMCASLHFPQLSMCVYVVDI